MSRESLPLLAGQVDGVLFDVDDTLVDTRSAFGVAMRRIAETYLPDLPADRHDEVLVHWRRDALGHYRAYTRGETTFRAQRLARANLLQEEFGGAPVPDEAFEEWDAVFEGAFQDGWAAHVEAASCVAGLAAHGLKIGALSNAAFDYQVLKLGRAGLGHVPMLVGVDTLGVGKPDPRVFLEACRLLGTEPRRTVYVGDELDVDARGAVAAGLRGVWVDRPGERRGGPHLEDPAVAEAEGIVVVPSLREVLGMLVADA